MRFIVRVCAVAHYHNNKLNRIFAYMYNSSRHVCVLCILKGPSIRIQFFCIRRVQSSKTAQAMHGRMWNFMAHSFRRHIWMAIYRAYIRQLTSYALVIMLHIYTLIDFFMVWIISKMIQSIFSGSWIFKYITFPGALYRFLLSMKFPGDV